MFDSAATKPTPTKLAIGAAFILAGVLYFGVSQFTKHQIQGEWLCTAADGKVAGAYNFEDHSNFMVTYSRYQQYYGDYDVEWKTIKTSIVGTTVGKIDADENNPLKDEIEFIEKSKGALLLRIWPANHPHGVVVSCEVWKK